MGYNSVEEVLQNNLIYKKEFNVYFDNLTKTLSKSTIDKIIRNLISIDEKFSLMLFDIDNFKTISDSFGPKQANDVLKLVGDALVETLKNDALIGRYSADEFVVLSNAYDYNDLWKFCKKAMDAVRNLKSPFKNFNITLTCGAATYPKDADSYDELFLKIDKALYRGKLKGRNCFIVYIDSLHKNIDISNRIERTTSLLDYCHREFMTKDTFNEKIKINNKFICDLLLLNCYYYDLEKNKIKTIIGNNNLKQPKEDFFKEILDKEDNISINDYSKLITSYPKFHEYCWDNNIKSLTIIKSFAFEKTYGYFIYIDSITKRVWNQEDKVVINYIVHMASMMKYYTEKNKKRKIN